MKKTILKSLPLITISLISFLAVILIGTAQANAQLNFEAQVPIPGMEGVVPVGTKTGGQIQSTLLGEYVKNIYNYSFAIAGILAAIVLMGGGVMWLVSGGNQSSISKAKETISGSLIGLGILFSAYILLRTINPALLEMRPISIDNIGAVSSNENRLGCCECVFVFDKLLLPDTADSSCQSNIGINKESCEELCGLEAKDKFKNLGTLLTTSQLYHTSKFVWDNTCSTASNGTSLICAPLSQDQAGSFPTIFDSRGWVFDEEINKQISDMSPELAQFLNCMRASLPNGVGRISSISDSGQIGTLTNCEGLLYDMNDCVHSKNSCHYGGGLKSNKSYAVDLGDEENYSIFETIAKQCDSGAFVLDEGDHTHINISKCPTKQ